MALSHRHPSFPVLLRSIANISNSVVHISNHGITKAAHPPGFSSDCWRWHVVHCQRCCRIHAVLVECVGVGPQCAVRSRIFSCCGGKHDAPSVCLGVSRDFHPDGTDPTAVTLSLLCVYDSHRSGHDYCLVIFVAVPGVTRAVCVKHGCPGPHWISGLAAACIHPAWFLPYFVYGIYTPR